MLIKCDLALARVRRGRRGRPDIGNPYGLADALRRSTRCQASTLDANPATAHMFIIKPFSEAGSCRSSAHTRRPRHVSGAAAGHTVKKTFPDLHTRHSPPRPTRGEASRVNFPTATNALPEIPRSVFAGSALADPWTDRSLGRRWKTSTFRRAKWLSRLSAWSIAPWTRPRPVPAECRR